MPKQTVTSGLAGKLGAKGARAFEEHKNDDTTFGGGGELPDGIEMGVAQLVECKFDTYKKGDQSGEYFFYAAGAVKAPKEVNGIRIEGLRTSIMEPMCDTPNRSRKTVSDHFGWVLNEMRKLGVDTREIDFDSIESVAAALKKQKPHFRFRTWKGEATNEYPNPRVNHEWRGVTEFSEEAESGVIDETVSDEAPSSNGSPKNKPNVITEDVPFGDDLDMLVDKAQIQKDADAQRELERRALKVGISQKEIDDADGWDSVATMIRNANKKTGGKPKVKEEEAVDYEALGTAADEGDTDAIEKLTEIAEEKNVDHNEYPTWGELATALASNLDTNEPEPPKKGDTFKYKPPKTKKAVDVEVTAVFKDTVNLKNIDDGKSTYKSVPFSELIEND